jgi:hypothetical protein
MTESFALLAIGFAVGLLFAAVAELSSARRGRRGLIELQRHQALPVEPPAETPQACTGDTIRLRTIDVARPLPDNQTIIIIRRRRLQ